MFGISIGEIFIILIVALIVIKPEDLPYYIKQIRKLMKKLHFIRQEILSSKEELTNIFNEEINLQDYSKKINEEVKEIIGEDGKTHLSYPQFLGNKEK